MPMTTKEWDHTKTYKTFNRLQTALKKVRTLNRGVDIIPVQVPIGRNAGRFTALVTAPKNLSKIEQKKLPVGFPVIH